LRDDQNAIDPNFDERSDDRSIEHKAIDRDQFGSIRRKTFFKLRLQSIDT